MRKVTFITVVALLAALFAAPAMASSDGGAIWKVAGLWDFTATISAEIPHATYGTVTIEIDETGTMDVHTKDGELEGREYGDYLLMSYDATATVSAGGQSQTKSSSVKDNKVELEGNLYEPGEDYTFEKTATVGSLGDVTEKVVLKQVEENKITGTVYLYKGDSTTGTLIAEGPVTATRETSSSSSSGCNAGTTAAMLVFCGLPMFFRKKK